MIEEKQRELNALYTAEESEEREQGGQRSCPWIVRRREPDSLIATGLVLTNGGGVKGV